MSLGNVGPPRESRMKQRKKTIYAAGYAKLPFETTAKHVYEILAIGLVLDPETGRILDFSCTTLPELGNDFLKEIFLGKKIDGEIAIIAEEIRARYLCRTRNAVLAALEDLLKRLKEPRKRNGRDKDHPPIGK